MKYKTQRKFILDQSGENQVFGMFCCCCLSFQFSFWICFFFFFISPYGCLSKPSWVHLHTVRKAKPWTCRQYLLHLSTRVSAQQCRAQGMCCPSSCTHHRPEKSSVTHPDVQVRSQNPKLGHTEGPFPLLFTQTIQLLTPSFRNSLSYLLHPHLHVDYSPQAPSQTAERDLLGFQFPLSPCRWLKWVKCLLTSNASFSPWQGEAWLRWRCLCGIPASGTEEMAPTWGLSPARSWVNSEISLWVFLLHWNPHELT